MYTAKFLTDCLTTTRFYGRFHSIQLVIGRCRLHPINKLEFILEYILGFTIFIKSICRCNAHKEITPCFKISYAKCSLASMLLNLNWIRLHGMPVRARFRTTSSFILFALSKRHRRCILSDARTSQFGR